MIYSQTAAMAWMTDGVSMNTNTGGGLFAGLKRSLTGGSLFITEFSADRGGHVAFAPRFPGSILVRELKAGESLICRKETFLCAEKSVGLGARLAAAASAPASSAARASSCRR